MTEGSTHTAAATAATTAATDSLLGQAPRGYRRAWAEVDLDAVRHNVRLLRHLVSPSRLCAVVKANGYGHGAVAVARAVVDAGASWLAVATVEEGLELRQSGITAPVLILSEPPTDSFGEVFARSLTPTVYGMEAVGVARREAASQRNSPVALHLKVDTGMHRVGADPRRLPALVEAVVSSPMLSLGGLWTHLAVADGVTDDDVEFTRLQIQRFEACFEHVPAGSMSQRPSKFVLHAANSAGAIQHPPSRLDMVRCGIALYGSLPSLQLAGALAGAVGELRPVMSLRAQVCHVQRLEQGERPSYGRLRALEQSSVVATVPLGYADGIPRSYFGSGGSVLIGGRRHRLAGAVTMDQIIVDCGPDSDVCVGDEVVLIGSQGEEQITAWEWAEKLGTISYEVLSRIGPRVERVVLDDDLESRSGR